MANNYIVKFEIGYMDAEFAFNNSTDAVSFMSHAVNNLRSVYDDKEFEASMRVEKRDKAEEVENEKMEDF